MKENKTLIFKIVRIVIFIAFLIGPSIMLLRYNYLNSIVFYSICIITGLVGMFLEIYKK